MTLGNKANTKSTICFVSWCVCTFGASHIPCIACVQRATVAAVMMVAGVLLFANKNVVYYAAWF